jgi:hypothetical protein
VQQRSFLWLKLSISKQSQKIHMAIHSFCNIHSYKKRKTSQGDFSIECGAQLALQAAPKINE